MKRTILHLLLLAALTGSSATGQLLNCASQPAASKLVCEFPFSTGVLANAAALGASSSASANGVASAQTVATSINIGIATQLSQLPLASASAGTIEVYNAGVPETFNNLGPILTDRAQVIGKGKVFVGATASQYVFTKIDGIPLSSLTFSYSQNAVSQGSVISTTYTSESTALSFRMNQLVSVATVGLSNKVDLSVIVPVERVSLGASTANSVSYVQNAGSSTAIGPAKNPNIYAAGTASGIGDIAINGKGVLWSGERATFSGGLTVRTPTGDDLNFLGSGAWGFNLHVLYSYLAKVSPHAEIGYQWNTTTELNNPSLTFGKNQSLPGGMQYDFGADWAAAKRVTVAADVLGSQYLNTPIYLPTNSAPISVATSATATPTSQELKSSTVENSTYTISNLSAGVKIDPVRNLVLSGNVLVQLIDNGLHARPTPLVGISYKF